MKLPNYGGNSTKEKTMDGIIDTIMITGCFFCYMALIIVPAAAFVSLIKWSIKRDKKNEAYARLVASGKRPPKKKK